MKYAYVLNWPEQPSAEKEFAFRLEKVFQELGHELLLVTEEQILTVPIKERSLNFGEFLFLPHFTSSPFEGMKNISLLWNSPKTVHEYRYGITNLCAADAFISGGSESVDKYFKSISGRQVLSPIFPNAIPIPCSSNIKPQSKLFYSGINWERITGDPTRHGELLKLLDIANLIDIYGPKKIRGVECWDGFINYKGEISMDGFSLIETAASYGVSLCLLNQQHIDWKMPSIRLAEAFAAKNHVISSQTPFLDFLGEKIFQIPINLTVEEQAKYIGAALKWILENPQKSRDNANEASAAWFERYSLEGQVLKVIHELSSSELNPKNSNRKYRVKCINPYSKDYSANLFQTLDIEDIDFIVHSEDNREKILEISDFEVMEKEKFAFAITNARLIHGDKDLIHPGLESYISDGPSFLTAETLILNCTELKEYRYQIRFGSFSETVEDIILNFNLKGVYLNSLSCKVSITQRFLIYISISGRHNLITPGPIFGLSRSIIGTINSGKKNILFSKLKRIIPIRIKDLIRPTWLRVKLWF